MATMHNSNAMLLRKHVGTATGPNGATFEMSLVNGYIPAVKDEATGKTYTLGWDDLIKMAVEAGVSEPEA